MFHNSAFLYMTLMKVLFNNAHYLDKTSTLGFEGGIISNLSLEMFSSSSYYKNNFVQHNQTMKSDPNQDLSQLTNKIVYVNFI